MPIDKIRFDFHKYLDYKECPKRFKLKYDRVDPPKPDNKYHSLFGTIVQHFFEWYANRWRSEGLRVSTYSDVRKLIIDKWRKMLEREYVDWNGFGCRMDSEQLLDSAIECILDNLSTDDFYENTESEIKIEAAFKTGDVWVGSMDFKKIIDNDPSRVWIIDGKSTDKLGKNIHIEQMLNYAWLHKYKYGFFPERLSFYYTRLKVFQDVSFDEVRLNNFRKDFLLTLKAAKEDTVYPATPKAKTCKYCPWKSTCAEHIADAATRKRSVPVAKFNDDGSTEMSFGSFD